MGVVWRLRKEQPRKKNLGRETIIGMTAWWVKAIEGKGNGREVGAGNKELRREREQDKKWKGADGRQDGGEYIKDAHAFERCLAHYAVGREELLRLRGNTSGCLAVVAFSSWWCWYCPDSTYSESIIQLMLLVPTL